MKFKSHMRLRRSAASLQNDRLPDGQAKIKNKVFIFRGGQS